MEPKSVEEGPIKRKVLRARKLLRKLRINKGTERVRNKLNKAEIMKSRNELYSIGKQIELKEKPRKKKL